jgi:tetratricopeptide (TPR) repeat protein
MLPISKQKRPAHGSLRPRATRPYDRAGKDRLHSIQKSRALSLADKHVREGEIHGAIDQYRQILEADPTDLPALNTLGDLWIRAGKIDEALSCFTQVAETYVEDGFTSKAIAVFKKMLRLDPVRPYTALKLADLCLKEGLLAEARQRLEDAGRAFAMTNQPLRALEIELRIEQIGELSGDVYSAISRCIDGIGLSNSAALWKKRTGEIDRLEPSPVVS